ncbi:caspase-3-like isoform X2 [Lingula anatina]|uniref:Caspase-3-like isoform X1 n=1 Tax=Lingula anatina TaxID=7574 RepID=A0A1S3J9P1_LINAN|nr:caspase-3-like isoform X1 [Lingula anatina]XP_023930695.1 caspase-3-like isoform X2 [Lingula anatina]|eukprot:XP_013406589.1 caspase-3-like isoform X1 [Lingula anatina]
MPFSANQKDMHRKLLVELSEDIDDEQYLDNLKRLLSGDIGQGRLAKAKDSLNLMNTMENVGILAVGKYDRLKDMFQHAGLNGLVTTIKDAEARIRAERPSLEVRPMEAGTYETPGPELRRKRSRLGTDASTGSSFDSETFSPTPRYPVQVAPGFSPQPSERVYPTEILRRNGLVVIINNFTEEREGSELDVRHIQRVFDGLLQYTVLTGPGYTNLSRELLDSKLQHIKDMLQEPPGYNRFFLIILSHGDKDGIRTCKTDGKTWDNKIITVNEITEIFRDTPLMIDLPKVIIIQACRGEDHQKATLRPDTCPVDDTEYLNLQMENLRIQISTPIDADNLVAYATTPGHIAWRQTDKGSWFIYNLCQVIDTYHRNEHFVDILTETSRRVADLTLPLESNGIKTVAKQMPIFVSTLRKKMYLIDT